MSKFTNFFKNAFGTETEEPELYSEEDIPPERKAELIGKFAQEIVDRRLSVPAILFVETVKPLSFLGSQAMVFFEPIIQSIFAFKSYKEIYLLLENRNNLELLLHEIEKREQKSK
ncbi:hypothetical protein KAX75_08760 [candidate division WOR-3 bacterium]|nr:hypothetical protein [candidate division WOR-3 bacterium]